MFLGHVFSFLNISSECGKVLLRCIGLNVPEQKINKHEEDEETFMTKKKNFYGSI
jgi:hypothetical protein